MFNFSKKDKELKKITIALEVLDNFAKTNGNDRKIETFRKFLITQTLKINNLKNTNK